MFDVFWIHTGESVSAVAPRKTNQSRVRNINAAAKTWMDFGRILPCSLGAAMRSEIILPFKPAYSRKKDMIISDQGTEVCAPRICGAATGLEILRSDLRHPTLSTWDESTTHF